MLYKCITLYSTSCIGNSEIARDGSMQTIICSKRADINTACIYIYIMEYSVYIYVCVGVWLLLTIIHTYRELIIDITFLV